MAQAVVEAPTSLMKARRKFKIRGFEVTPGDVVDLEALDLPAGRAMTLVNRRYGTFLTEGEPTVPPAGWTPEYNKGTTPTPEPAVQPAGTLVDNADEIIEAAEAASFPRLTAADMRGMKKAELVAECSARGLATSGNRSELIDRLTTFGSG